MEIIHLPQIEHPTLCFQCPPLDFRPNPMVHCTLPKDHAGPHSWERAGEHVGAERLGDE